MIKIIGTGLDALVASIHLSAGSVPHSWDDGESVGRHFAGWQTRCENNATSDIGMVLLETQGENLTKQTLDEFNFESSVDALPFVWNVYRWLGQIGFEELDVHSVSAIRGDQIIPDYFISDQLDVLNNLSMNDKQVIRREIGEIMTSSTFSHPRLRRENPRWSGITVSEGLHNSIGRTATELLFGKYLRMFSRQGQILFRDHRIWWLPSYWPETLIEALGGHHSLPPSDYFRPRDLSVAGLVCRMRKIAMDSEFLHRPGEQSTRSEIIDFSAGGRKYSAYCDFSVIHFCVNTERFETFFLPDCPLGISKITTSPLVDELGAVVKGVSSLLVEVPSERVSPESYTFSSIKRKISDMGWEIECTGSCKVFPFPCGQPLDSKPFLSQNFNDAVLRGIKSAELIVS